MGMWAERIKYRLHRMWLYLATLFKWMTVGALIGGVGGVVGTLFHMGVDHATEIRLEHGWVIYLLPVGGLLIAAIYRLTKTEGRGTNDIIRSVHFGSHIPVVLVPVIFVSTVITHLCGGSAGREGAALQIGGGIGYKTGTLLRMHEKDLPLATMCGMSGVFAALFGTPLTAMIFSLEVISVGVLYYAGLVPCLVAAMTGYRVSTMLGVPPTRFTIPTVELETGLMLRVIVLTVLCAVVSIVLCRVLHWMEHNLEFLIESAMTRAFMGGCLLLAMTLVLGSDYNGAGMDVIERALAGEADALAWLWKILFTVITIGCGFKGGEVVPSFFIGATFGCVAGGLLGVPVPLAAAVGLICVFCGAVNCPMASMMLSVELFGAGNLIYFAMGCVISFLISGYSGLYKSQRIVYSKMRAEFINVNPW